MCIRDRNKDGRQIQPGAQPGDVRYKDWNGDGMIDENDQHDVGNPVSYTHLIHPAEGLSGSAPTLQNPQGSSPSTTK